MTDEDVKKFMPMAKKLAWKYRGISDYLEVEDLEQICYLGLLKAYDTYRNDGRMRFSTYVYSMMEWQIFQEARKYNRIDRFCMISLNTPTNSDDETLTVEDLIGDIKVNVENTVIDRLTICEYYNEISKVLNGTQLEVMLLRVFDGLSYEAIGKRLNLDTKRVQRIFIEARRKLVRRSPFFYETYKQIYNINDNPYSGSVENIAINNVMNGGDLNELEEGTSY